MVAKRKKVPDTVSVEDRLKLQLLNSYVDRAQETIEKFLAKLEMAKMGVAGAQSDLSHARADLDSFGEELKKRYNLNLDVDRVDWGTGAITRSVGEGDEA